MNDDLPNPYVGPKSFERGGHHKLYGRDSEIEELTSLIIGNPVVVIYAQSGAGKTSLVNAGLIPRLEKVEGFHVFETTRFREPLPSGINPSEIINIFVFQTLVKWDRSFTERKQLPLTELSRSTFRSYLSHAPKRKTEDGVPILRIAFFDQFEELFTVHSHKGINRQKFFRYLGRALAVDPSLRVVFMIREDYLARLDPFSGLLPDRLRTRFELERLREDGARSAIQEPLEGTGRSISDQVCKELITRLRTLWVTTPEGRVEFLDDFIEPVQLQVVCHSTWRRWPAKKLIDKIEDIGNVSDALVEFYNSAVEEAARVANISEGLLRRWIEKSLITPEGTRGIVHVAQGADLGVTIEAIKKLDELRLIRSEFQRGADWFELTHDTLIEPVRRANRLWSGNLSQFDQFLDSVRERAIQPNSKLLTKPELAQLDRLLLQTRLDITDDTLIGFINRSREAVERVRKQRRKAAELLKRWVIALEVAVGIAILLGLYSIQLRSKAFARELASAAETVAQTDPQLSILLSQCALHQPLMHFPSDAPIGDSGLLRGIFETLPQKPFPYADVDQPNSAISPNGRFAICKDRFETIRVFNTLTPEKFSNVTHKGIDKIIAIANDGSRIMVRFDGERSAHILNWKTGKDISLKCLNQGLITAGAFDWSGRYVVANEQPASEQTANEQDPGWTWGCAVWAFENAAPQLKGFLWAQTAGFFDPKGDLVTLGEDCTAALWDVELLSPKKTSDGKPYFSKDMTSALTWAAFSPDGKQIATAGIGRAARIWKRDGTPDRYIPNTSTITCMAFSPSGELLAASGADGTARVWDLTGRRTTLNLVGYSSPIYRIAFADEDHVTTIGLDGAVRIWTLQRNVEFETVPPLADRTLSRRLSPTSANKSLLTVIPKVVSDTPNLLLEQRISDSRQAGPALSLETVGLGSATSRPQIQSTPDPLSPIGGAPNGVYSVSIDRIGKTNYLEGSGRWATISDPSSHDEIPLNVLSDDVTYAAFSLDSELVAVGIQNGTTRIFKASGEEVGRTSSSSTVLTFVFDGSGRRFITAQENSVRVGDLVSKEALPEIQWPGVSCAAISADGEKIAIGTGNGALSVGTTGSNPTEVYHPDIPWRENGIVQIAFNPVKKREQIFFLRADNTAWLWEPKSEPRRLPAPKGHFSAVRFEESGDRLLIAIDGSTYLFDVRPLTLWNASKRREPTIFPGMPENVLLAINFSDDGHFVWTADSSGVTRRYSTLIENYFKMAKERLDKRQFTLEEREEYLHEPVGVWPLLTQFLRWIRLFPSDKID